MLKKSELAKTIRSLPQKNKFVLVALVAVGTLCLVGAFWIFNNKNLIEIPETGGKYFEGVVGAPRFINPLLAISDTDRDLSALIYSGLMRKDKTNRLVPDLAESYKISDDGLTYTFVLRDKLFWHDGTPLTTADIVFTVAMASNQEVKSIKAGTWNGITVRAEDKQTVVFHLPQSYSSFLGQTTLGILPAHIWKDVPTNNFSFSEYNIKPVGSGPYQLVDIKKSAAGLPEYYELSPFTRFALDTPHIKTLRLYFFPNENDLLQAFEDKHIDSLSGITPETALRLSRLGQKVNKSSLPRVFGIFFNQNQAEVFTQSEVREALNETIDKKYIADKILKGYARPLNGPLPPNSFSYEAERFTPMSQKIEGAKSLLAKAGWQAGPDGVLTKKGSKSNYRLEFTITTADVAELKSIATLAKNQWEKLGAKVEIKVLDTSTLQQNAIRPRKYDALLFGIATGDDGDLYPFWHSSQRLDPGLNIAMYTNAESDRLLDRIKLEPNYQARTKLISRFFQEINKDRPAIFIYSPDFIYIVPKELKAFSLPNISIPADRFATVYQWYVKTDRVWPVFAPQKTTTTTSTVNN